MMVAAVFLKRRASCRFLRREKMKVESYDFGVVVIDGEEYTHDLIVDHGKLSKRKKKKSKQYKARYGHTPLTEEENIPWNCKRLIIGTGMSGALPVTEGVKQKAKNGDIELTTMKTPDALKHLNDPDTNLVLHLTC